MRRVKAPVPLPQPTPTPAQLGVAYLELLVVPLILARVWKRRKQLRKMGAGPSCACLSGVDYEDAW